MFQVRKGEPSHDHSHNQQNRRRLSRAEKWRKTSRWRAGLMTKSMISDEVSAVRAKIAGVLARRPECFITHPSELGILQRMTRTEIDDLAYRNGWSLVCRLGGRQYQFYNDAFERALNAVEV